MTKRKAKVPKIEFQFLPGIRYVVVTYWQSRGQAVYFGLASKDCDPPGTYRISSPLHPHDTVPGPQFDATTAERMFQEWLDHYV